MLSDLKEKDGSIWFNAKIDHFMARVNGKTIILD